MAVAEIPVMQVIQAPMAKAAVVAVRVVSLFLNRAPSPPDLDFRGGAVGITQQMGELLVGAAQTPDFLQPLAKPEAPGVAAQVATQEPQVILGEQARVYVKLFQAEPQVTVETEVVAALAAAAEVADLFTSLDGIQTVVFAFSIIFTRPMVPALGGLARAAVHPAQVAAATAVAVEVLGFVIMAPIVVGLFAEFPQFEPVATREEVGGALAVAQQGNQHQIRQRQEQVSQRMLLGLAAEAVRGALRAPLLVLWVMAAAVAAAGVGVLVTPAVRAILAALQPQQLSIAKP